MSIPMLARDEFLQLRSFIKLHCGIDLTDSKDYLVEGRLRSLVMESGCRSFPEFCNHLQRDPSAELRERIIDAMTTNETLWFRDASCWDTLRNLLSNHLVVPGRSRLSVWSGACATGQEPYSLAMEISELRRLNPVRLKNITLDILATDISATALARARLGRYDQISIARGLPEPLRDRYFTLHDKVWVLNQEIRDRVRFQKFNLQDEFSGLGRFDLILMRNVLIYFSNELKEAIFRKIRSVLNPGGFLIVGASESVIPVTRDFELVELGKGVCYQVKSGRNGIGS